jgi:PKD repeat protein
MKLKLIITFFFCIIYYAINAQTTFFTQNSNWNYKDDGSNQGTVWKSTTFDDALWLNGNSQFGYGEGDEATILNACGTVVQNPSCTNKYITTYFRKTFNISDINLYQSFTFNMLRDDGVVIYINGNEVQRNNMPSGSVTYTTLASAAASDDGQSIVSFTLSKAASFLNSGNNVIAVELHQSSASSSDLTFSMELIANFAGSNAIITRGPYLQKANENSITFRWRTDIACDSKIFYGTDSLNLANNVVSGDLVTEHTVVLSGLQAATKYFYGLGNSTGIIQVGYDNYFITSPQSGTPGKYRFWVTGDCGTGYAEQLQVLNQYINYTGNTPTNGWLLLGDNAYTGGFDNEYTTNFFTPYQGSIMKKTPLWPVPGNHDYDNNGTNQNTHAVPYYNIFDLPSQAECGGVASNTEAFYSYDYGNIHFLALDSYGKENNATRLYDTTGAQVQWIKNDLAANTKPWVIAYWHHPPYTMGSHNSDTEGELVSIRSNFIRILERMGVDLVMCGHSHAYERTKLMKEHYGLEPTFNASINNLSNSSGKYDGSNNSCTYLKDTLHNSLKGAVYVVSGSAGKFGGTSAGYPHNAMEYSNVSNPGSVILDFDDNRLDVKWLCGDGVIRDQFTMMKNTGKVRCYTINEGDSILLTASWKGQYVWNNNGSTSKQNYAKPTVNSTIIVADQYQCVTDTFKITVLPLVADFNVQNSTICAGTNVVFSNNSSSNAISLLWSFPGGTPNSSADLNPTITYNSPGIYPVSLTVYHGNASNTKTVSALITVNPLLQPQITISSDFTSICAGGNINFTSQILNGGSLPIYNWKIDGISVGTNSSQFSSNSIHNGQIVSCELISNENCVSINTVQSNVITINVTDPVVPTVVISQSIGSNPACSGSNLGFTAIANNAGLNPVYQWKINGNNVGLNSNTFSASNLINNDIVSCEITSNASCASPLTAVSNGITLVINPLLTPSVSIALSSGTNPFCANTNIGFIATALNAGANPIYQWKINGTNVGLNSNTFSASNLINNDIVSCEITSNASCASPLTAVSNGITLSINNCSGVPNTKLRTADCGKQNLALNAALVCDIVSGASNYDFEFTNLSTNVVSVKTTTSNSVSLSSIIPAIQFGTQYNVRVRAKLSGVYGIYGAICNIGTVCNPTICGVPLTQLRTTDCGKLNLSPLSGQIIADPVAAASQYEFEFRNITTNAVYATKLQTSNVLVLSTVSPPLQWNTQYNVKVRAYIAGIAGSYGNNCLIGLIPDPSVAGVPNTQLATASCGKTNLALTGSISCNAVTGANSYEWEFKDQANVVVVATKISSGTSVNLGSVTGIQWNTQYNVRVRAYIGTVAGNYNISCLIGLIPDPAISGVPSTKLRSSDCGKLNFGLGGFAVADVVSGAAEYDFEIRNNITNVLITNKLQASNVLTFSTVPALTWNTQYKICVRARIAGTWGTYGAACTIGFICDPNICGVPTTNLRNTDCGKLNFNFSTGFVVANTVPGATLYEFEITDISTNSLITVQARTNMNLYFNTITPALLSNKQYSIRVRATISGVVGSYGSACTIGFANSSKEVENSSFDKTIIENNLNDELFMLKAYPNPFSEQTTLLITTAGHELLQLQIFDLTGKKVWHNFVYTNQNIIIGSELSVGTYIAQVIQNNGTIHNIKFIKNK